MDSKTAMEAIKAASARGDLMEVERIYADACADIGNIIQDKAALCLYCVYAFLNVKDYIGAYQSVLNAYRMAYQAGGHTAQYAMANGLSPMIAHSGHVGYAFKDLDKDGTPELFIAGLNTDEAAKSAVYDVYALIGGVPTRLAVSSEQDCFYLCTDNTLFNIASAGTGTAHYFTYRFRNNRLGAVDGYKSCPTDNARVKYNYQTGAYTPEVQKTDVPITENEFGTRVFERVNTVFQLLYTQLA